jgi:hypothetical protein
LYKVVSERFQLQSSEMMEDLISQRYFARCAPSTEKVVTVDFGGPVVGSGWYKTERSAHGPFRWMGGGKDGGTIYFPGRVGGSIKVRLYLIRLAAGVGREDITLFLDGRPMEWQFEPTQTPAGMITARIPDVEERDGHVLSIFTRTWSPPSPQDGRPLALSVSKAELSVV